MKLSSIIHIAALCLLLLCAGAQPSWAGSGTFDNGEYNFCVSVRFNATPAQLAQIRTAFDDASQIFADALDGQQRFGTVTIVNDSGASKSADYWVNAGPGDAKATHGRYGVRGQHVNLFFGTNFNPLDAGGNAYTIAHEHVHHSFGVVDEYSGPLGSAECAPPPDTATLNFSLMDNYFTRGGRAFGGGYTLNELCTAANHDPDGDTYQQHVHGVSAWETVAAHPKRSANAPAGLPVDAPPAPQAVAFQDGFGGLRVVLLLDRSGSMASQQRLDFAKSGGSAFVGRLQDGDGVGVASFACTTSVDFPLTSIAGNATRAAARSAINSLSAAGSTNIGGGLLEALGSLTSQSKRSCNEIIVLLSDGDHNCGTAPATVIPQLQQEGVTVITVGVGSGLTTAGEATLQSVASATGGRFFRVSNSFDLVGLFLRLVAESLGNGLLVRAPGQIHSGEVREVAALVEMHAKSATFALAIGETTDEITFTLQTPSGRIIDEQTAGSDPSVEFESESNSRVFRVANPEAGEWTLLVSAGTVVSGEVEVLAFAEHDGVDLNLVMDREMVTFPEAMQIEATPTYDGFAVLGVEIQGVVRRPDGSNVAITLFDDGDIAANGDKEPGDGVYAARFDNFAEDGTYIFDLTAVSIEDFLSRGEALFVDESSRARKKVTFTRRASATAILTGSPGVLAATLELMPEPLDLRSRGSIVKAHIELPSGFDPVDIDVTTVALSAIDGQQLATPVPAISSTAVIGDSDNDGIPDLTVSFNRRILETLLTRGVQEVTVEGQVAGQHFRGSRFITVVPKNPAPIQKE